MQKKWLYLIVLSLIWGSSFILIKKSLIGLTPLQLGALRILFTTVFLLLIGFKSISKIQKHEWKWITISALLGTFFPAFLFAYAETEIDSAVASILNSLVPINTIIIGSLIFKIASSVRQFISIIIGFIGTVFLIYLSAELNPTHNYLYASFILIATLMYAANVNIIKKHMQTMSPMAIAVGNFVVISIPALVVLLFSNFFTVVDFKEPTVQKSLIYVAILAVFGTALAKIMFNKLVQISTPVFASSVTYLMPIIALAWGLFDDEIFGLWQLLASAIILLGVYLANKNKG